MTTYFHSGDLGDVIAALPTIRQLGGGHLILGNRNGVGGREPMTQKRFDAIAPLLKAQPYITGVELQNDPPQESITHDFHRFREKAPGEGYNLATWQADYLGITDLDLSPWLVAEPNPEAEGKAVFSRTFRYHNRDFNWLRVVERHAGAAIFVGLHPEWVEWSLEHQAGTRVLYRPTDNLLEIAELIAACDVFCGNQSSPFWIAAALGRPLIQETDIYNLNSVVPRDNAKYFTNGVVDERGNPVWIVPKKRRVHCIPVGDKELHSAQEVCWCQPIETEPRLFVHNAKDCREAHERISKKKCSDGWVLIAEYV